MRRIDKLIVHCSDTSNELDITVEEIRSWHLERGWKDIGYHYVIYRDGTIHLGRPVSEIGAHCRGHNRGSIGVCLIGKDEFTPEQFKSLKNLWRGLKNIFHDLRIKGHRDFTDLKTCPNFEVKDIITN